MDTPLLLWIMRVLIMAQPEDGVTNFQRIEIMTNGLSNGVILISQKQKQLKKKKNLK
jgi:hypothetical protein